MLRIGILKPHPATYNQELVAAGESGGCAQHQYPRHRTSESQLLHVVPQFFRFRIDPTSLPCQAIWENFTYFRLSTKYNSVSVFQDEYMYDFPSGVICTDAG